MPRLIFSQKQTKGTKEGGREIKNEKLRIKKAKVTVFPWFPLVISEARIDVKKSVLENTTHVNPEQRHSGRKDTKPFSRNHAIDSVAPGRGTS